MVNNILRNRRDGSLSLAHQQLLQNYTDSISQADTYRMQLSLVGLELLLLRVELLLLRVKLLLHPSK